MARWHEAESHRNIGPDYPTYALWCHLLAEKNPDIDLFDGFGNGSLHFIVGTSINTKQYIELDFAPADWEALFVKSLGRFSWKPCQEGETSDACHERNRQAFQNALSNYPLLSRIFDMYEDAKYAPEDVPLLRDECQRAKEKSSDFGAIRALRKLIFACDAAIKSEGRLTLECD